MQGVISYINNTSGFVAILTQTEGYSIFEIISEDNFEIGDEVSWSESHPLGEENIINITKDEIMSVYFQNHWINKDDLKKYIS